MDVADLETLLGVEYSVFVVQAPAAFRNDADSAPGAIRDFEHLGKKPLSLKISGIRHDPLVGILDVVFPLLQLNDSSADTIEQVERFKAGDDDRNLKLVCQRRILPVAHDAANMSGRKKCLHMIVRRAHDRLDRGGNEHVRY